jgi:phosphoglycerate dehydrogenase-like enzyme
VEDVIRQADIVTLHVPLHPTTVNLVDDKFIASMKPGCILINTSRGELVDENALLDGLSSGQLSGAGLDVLSQEPPSPDHPFLKLSNVLITPHTGAHTDAATNAMGWTALQDCFAVLEGRDPKYPVI